MAMNLRGAVTLGVSVLASMLLVPAGALGTVGAAASVALLPGCGKDCETRNCSELVSDTSNKRTYQHCTSCGSGKDSGCDVEARREDGSTIYECNNADDHGRTDEGCVHDIVEKEASYCSES